MPDNSQWWQNAQPGEKPWEAARRAKEAKAKPQETRGVIRRAWDALNRPVIPVERGVRAVLPEKQMGPAGEHAAGGAIGLGRVAESLSSPAALGSLGTIGLLSRPGVLGDILMGFLSGDMGWEAIKNLRRTNDTDYGDALPREKTADYTAATAHGALAVAPWLHMGARAARGKAQSTPKPGPIPEEFRVNVDPEVRSQVELPLTRPEPTSAQAPPAQATRTPPPATRRPEVPADSAVRDMEARNQAEATARQAEAQRQAQAAQEAKVAQEQAAIREWHNDPLVGDERVRSLRETFRDRDYVDEAPVPETPWHLFEDALGAEIVPKPAKPPKFRDQRIEVEDPYKPVIDFILERGGINIGATKKAGTFEDWQQSLGPNMYRRIMRRKGGFSPDDMAMNLEPFGITGENSLREVLANYRKQEPIRITKDEQMRQYEERQAEWERRNREEVPQEWLDAMELDTANAQRPPFRQEGAPIDREGFMDYELAGVREPGQEGFADISMNKGVGADADEFTLVKVQYNDPSGVQEFFDVVHGATGRKALAKAREMHPEASKIELDIDDSPTQLGGDYVKKHTDAYYDKLGEMGLDPYWRNQAGFADTKPEGPKSVGMFADELLGVQSRQRQEATGDLFNKILQADPAAISKRKLLGLDKKKARKADTPLLDTIKTQKSMFEE